MRRGERLGVFDCRLTLEQRARHARGPCSSIEDDGFDLRLNGGVLHVKRVQPQGARKVSAGGWAAEVGLKVGARFR